MKKLVDIIKKIWAWLTRVTSGKWEVLIKLFTSKSFVLGFPFCVFLLGSFIAWSWMLFICAIIWLFPLILGIHEEEA